MIKAVSFIVKAGALASLSLATLAATIEYQPGKYPAPRYPELPKEITLEHLMPVARNIVARKEVGYRYYPGWDVKAGERTLIVGNDNYDPLVIEALKKAIQEVGAKADVLYGNDALPNIEDEDNWGHYEVDYYVHPRVAINHPFGGVTPKEQLALALEGKYDAIFSGTGGAWPSFPKDKLRWVYFPWEWSDQLLMNGANIPPELLLYIDKKAWEKVKKSVKFHAYDPEGTDLTWTQTPLDWQEIEKRYGPLIPGHQMPAIEGTPVNGTIAGTWSDTGPFERIQITMKDGKVVDMVGGGKYAEKWRATMEEWKKTDWPGKPGPGLFTYMEEVAYSTNPNSVVPLASATYPRAHAWDRTRSGITHWGIGGGGGEGLPALVEKGGTSATKFYKEHPEVPRGHLHIHNFFLTLEATDKDGNTYKLIDKGRLTVLDDPDVRREAAKYGDPDELLTEKWIPAIPGINVEGDYAEFSKNPGPYVRKYFQDLKAGM